MDGWVGCPPIGLGVHSAGSKDCQMWGACLTNPFVAEVLEARQHDELVVDHFFEANTEDADSTAARILCWILFS